MVQNDPLAPKWGLPGGIILRSHYNGADVSGKGARSRLPVCGDSPQMRAAKRFALPWRIHGTEAAYLVPIDSMPGMSGICASVSLISGELEVDVQGWVS
jgi:hypothetical protein